MYVSIFEIDLVEVLNLNRSMSVGEIETVLDNLSKETYFRFLFEELPKLINKEDYDEISQRNKTGDDMDKLMEELNTRWPDLQIEFRLQQISSKIKKEFILNYLSEMKNDYQDRSLHLNIDKLISEIKKDQIDKDLCWKIKDVIGKQVDKINKK
jgi:hypothetical protein